jgi:hypothetical protein
MRAEGFDSFDTTSSVDETGSDTPHIILQIDSPAERGGGDSVDTNNLPTGSIRQLDEVALTDILG